MLQLIVRLVLVAVRINVRSSYSQRELVVTGIQTHGSHTLPIPEIHVMQLHHSKTVALWSGIKVKE